MYFPFTCAKTLKKNYWKEKDVQPPCGLKPAIVFWHILFGHMPILTLNFHQSSKFQYPPGERQIHSLESLPIPQGCPCRSCNFRQGWVLSESTSKQEKSKLIRQKFGAARSALGGKSDLDFTLASLMIHTQNCKTTAQRATLPKKGSTCTNSGSTSRNYGIETNGKNSQGHHQDCKPTE